jgi:hypothetical protein
MCSTDVLVRDRDEEGKEAGRSCPSSVAIDSTSLLS